MNSISILDVVISSVAYFGIPILGYLTYEIRSLRKRINEVDEKYNKEVFDIKKNYTSLDTISTMVANSETSIKKDIKLISADIQTISNTINIQLDYLKKDMSKLDKAIEKLEK